MADRRKPFRLLLLSCTYHIREVKLAYFSGGFCAAFIAYLL